MNLRPAMRGESVSSLLAFLLAAAGALSAGCASEPPRSVQYGSAAYRPTPRPVQPNGTPRVKSVAAANTTVATAPTIKTAPMKSSVSSGGLDDIVARIKARDAEKAREASAAKRKHRDAWLAAHETDLGGVRSRLNSMRVFVSMESNAEAKAAVRRAISETETQLDALIGRVGNGRVGFAEASEFRSALESRHERLLESCAPYRAALGGSSAAGR